MNPSATSLKGSEFVAPDADLLEAVIDGRSATYVSVPITTGKRFVEWWRDRGRKLASASSELYDEEHYRAVVQPNLEAARKGISKLRSHTLGIVIEPTSFKKPEWDQMQFRVFWAQIIQRFAAVVIFMEGWEYSSGCSYEYLIAFRSGVKTLDEHKRPLPPTRALSLMQDSLEETKKCSAPIEFLQKIFEDLQAEVQLGQGLEYQPVLKSSGKLAIAAEDHHSKDSILNRLAELGNIAQFVSFSPELKQRYSRISGFETNGSFGSTEQAISTLLKHSPDALVNVRSYRPGQPKGQPLRYGLESVSEVMEVLRENRGLGNFSIVNETVDIHDGGVSGVALDNIIEFAPDDSPQCVEKPGICTLPRYIGLHVLERVYGFRPVLVSDASLRIEFSIHPKRRGIRQDHTLLWEQARIEKHQQFQTVPRWPNNFSRLVGDKAFGLLVADAIGLRVPKTTVVSRRIAPFTFGQSTGTGEAWIRTCPRERVPGKYPTFFGWRGPFELLALEDAKAKIDPDYIPIMSVLSQDGVHPEFSGKSAPFFESGITVEGRRGMGDEFMLGLKGSEQLPESVMALAKETSMTASRILGPVAVEWVFDGKSIWVVQLNLCGTPRPDRSPIHIQEWHRFDASTPSPDNLNKLRAFAKTLDPAHDGVILLGEIGYLSHMGEVLGEAGLLFQIKMP